VPDAQRVLIVEDEAHLAEGLRFNLEAEGYHADVVDTGEAALQRLLAGHNRFDLVVLDVMLPGRDGFEILAALRAQGLTIPVLMLTARDAVPDRIHGLDQGADDYMVKPFAFPELVARIRARLRRGRPEQALEATIADLRLNIRERRVVRGGADVDLTPREFELLEYLVRHSGHLVSREMLARDVWHETARGTPLDNVIDVHIARLRKKVDTGHEVKLIHTVRGVGFVVKEERA
jgi:two-component system copper resistance phosphate regulon response regulator CusR